MQKVTKSVTESCSAAKKAHFPGDTRGGDLLHGPLVEVIHPLILMRDGRSGERIWLAHGGLCLHGTQERS
jgi:hypothetical protein